MKILFVSQYYFPEANAPAHRVGFFAESLANYGHEISVICEPPNHPRGILFPGFKNAWHSREKLNNVNVIRSWVWITEKKTFIFRVLNYFSFFFSSIFASFTVGKIDVVYTSSPPLPVLFSGWIISKIKRATLVSEIRDIWPDSIVAVGMMSRGLVFRVLQAMEKFVYRGSKIIVVNAEGIKKRLVENKGVIAKKIHFLPNGADIDFFSSYVDVEPLNNEFGLKNKFVVLFTGLLGLAQDPEMIIRVAKEFKNEPEVVFVLAGDGPLMDKCVSLSKKLDLQNVHFAGQRPRSEMPMFCSRADVALITYKNSPLFKDVIPSKMFDYMASSKPVIINLNGEGARIILDAKCGFIADPESEASIAGFIKKLRENPDLREKMGEQGRQHVILKFNKKEIAKMLDKTISVFLN